jgi:hypothetical protein
MTALRFVLIAAATLALGACTIVNSTAEFGDPEDAGDQDADAHISDSGLAPDAGDGGVADADAGMCAGECMPGTDENGLNACGNDATRSCNDDCSWGPFNLAESVDTCDYCDDDPDGIREQDAGFASLTRTHELTSTVRLEGEAFGTCFGTTCFIDLVIGDGLGGSFVPDPTPIGYGPAAVTINMRSSAGGATPGLGWAFVAYLDPAPVPILGNASDLGVNLSADGFAVEWSTFGTDSVRVRRLDATGADPVIDEANTGAELAGPMGSVAVQEITVTWAPDDPSTPANETTVLVEHPCPVAPTCGAIGCGGTTGVMCAFTIRPGDLLRYGVVAAATTTSPAQYRLENSTISLSRLCPG